MKRLDFAAAPRCPGSLKEGFTTYNPATLRNVFNGKKVFHVLDEFAPQASWQNAALSAGDFPNQRWYRMELFKNKLKPSANGNYVLKTIIQSGSNLRFDMEQPANEHLCMQLASQVFNLETIPNALIFFADGQPAIIYKYYPVMNTFLDFQNLFATQSSVSNLKYYRQIMDLIDKHAAASILMKERFFIQIIFSWLTTNATAHAKYAGLVKSDRGDFAIAPVNGIQCTRIHELCDELAMKGGLFEGDKNTPEFREYGHYTLNEFSALAGRSGIASLRFDKIIDFILSKKTKALDLINRAFLPDEAKSIFKFNFNERIERLR